MAQKRGLGRGLDALLAGSQPAAKTSENTSEIQQDSIHHLALECLQRGKYQPRRDMDTQALEELSISIQAQGVMQPILVRSVNKDKYEIIAGERRWRACKMAGLLTIPAIIKEVSDDSAIAMALIENIQRENLNSIEEAFALKRLMDEFELTQAQTAKAIGKSRSAVANILRLLRLNDEVKTLLEHGDIEVGHAKLLLTLESALQINIAHQIIANNLTVRETEALLKKLQSPNQPAQIIKHKLIDLEAQLNAILGAKVSVMQDDSGKGRMVINFKNQKQLDAILETMQED